MAVGLVVLFTDIHEQQSLQPKDFTPFIVAAYKYRVITYLNNKFKIISTLFIVAKIMKCVYIYIYMCVCVCVCVCVCSSLFSF